jgi:predicted dehydrogenase
MAAEVLNAAIVGLGWWGKTLVRAVQGKSDRMRFVAGTSARPETHADFAQENGLELVESFEALLGMPGLDAVVLATPHIQHEAQIAAAAGAGLHVFVEKPFTLDKASAERAVDAVRNAGKALGLGHNRRFHPNMEVMRDRVRSGALGTILHCEASMTAPNGLFLKPDSWRNDPRQSPAGGMAGLGIHLIDGMIDLIGPVSEVMCRSHHRATPSGAEDTTFVTLAFRDGVTGYLSCMTATAPTYRFGVFGSKGVAEITTPSLEHFSFTPTPDAPLSGHAAPKPVERIHTPALTRCSWSSRPSPMRRWAARLSPFPSTR